MKYLLIILLLFSCQTRRKVKPKLPATTYKEKAFTHMSKQEFDEALIYLNDCINYYPNNKSCHWELGWVYYAKANWRDTVKHWEVANNISALKKGEFKFLEEARNMLNIHNVSKRFNYTKLENTETDDLLQINSVGDVMMGSSFPNADFPSKNKNDLFINIAKQIPSQAINFLNLEGPLCNEGKSLKCKEGEKNKCYSFRTPTEYSRHIEGKFNVASIANNHIMDFGHSCYEQTVETLNSNNIKPSDGFGNFAEITNDIALISFYTHKLYDYNLLDIPQSYKQVKNLSKKYRIVIVSFHGGAEGHRFINIPFKKESFKGTNRGDVYKFAKRMIDAGADLVLGHGPHIVRSMHIYKRKLIAFSLGNFFTYGRFNLLGNQKHGVILKTFLNPMNGNFKFGKLISTVQRDGELLIDKNHNAAKLIFALSKIDFKQKQFNFNQDFSFTPAKQL